MGHNNKNKSDNAAPKQKQIAARAPGNKNKNRVQAN